MTAPRMPQANTAIYRAAAIISAEGPQTAAALFTQIDFGKAHLRFGKIEDAIRTGWLTESDGRIGISEFARLHFGGKPEAPATKFVGKVTTTREPLTPWCERPSLSRKNIPSSQANRDVPQFSVRVGQSFRSVGGRPL